MWTAKNISVCLYIIILDCVYGYSTQDSIFPEENRKYPNRASLLTCIFSKTKPEIDGIKSGISSDEETKSEH